MVEWVCVDLYVGVCGWDCECVDVGDFCGIVNLCVVLCVICEVVV